ncbi:MAG TPA: hypothetical protein VGZ03_05195 [Acidimicrobiales bacterium]|nr:hypothetical protein [Acidimicrobiales bacterium]
MSDEDDRGPRPLSDSLRRLAARVVRVDLVGFAGVEAVWGSVTAAVASGAVPLRLSDGALTVVVATGAHATRARRDAAAMLAQLGELLDRAPTTLQVTVRPG